MTKHSTKFLNYKREKHCTIFIVGLNLFSWFVNDVSAPRFEIILEEF
jgi:hypothetical protein